MTPAELISALERESVHLALNEAGGLHYRGDRAKMAVFLPAIRQHKRELLAFLSAELPANEPLLEALTGTATAIPGRLSAPISPHRKQWDFQSGAWLGETPADPRSLLERGRSAKTRAFANWENPYEP